VKYDFLVTTNVFRDQTLLVLATSSGSVNSYLLINRAINYSQSS